MNEILVGFLWYFVADGLEELAEFVVLVFGEHIIFHECVEKFKEVFGQIACEINPTYLVIHKSNKI